MALRRSTLVFAVSMFAFVNTAHAELNVTGNLFGNEQQPGYRLHVDIAVHYNDGEPFPIVRAIDAALEDDNTLLGVEAKQALAFNVEHANAFYHSMIENNSLIEVTKRLLEVSPNMVVHTITLAVILYPDYTQEIYEGASLTGILNNDDLLVVLSQAGADPYLISDATAADGPIAESVPPLGAGIGAGGTGGGDITASTN